MNAGIITSLFSSSVVFAAVAFYIMYKQKIGIYQSIGMLFIVGSVTMVSFGGDRELKKTSADGITESVENI